MNTTIYGTYLHTKLQHIDIVERLHLKLKIKRDLPGKLKFDWNSTSHQSGTEELHERARASYLVSNIQRRNRECEQEHGTEELGWEGIILPDPGHVIPPFLTDDL